MFLLKLTNYNKLLIISKINSQQINSHANKSELLEILTKNSNANLQI